MSGDGDALKGAESEYESERDWAEEPTVRNEPTPRKIAEQIVKRHPSYYGRARVSEVDEMVVARALIAAEERQQELSDGLDAMAQLAEDWKGKCIAAEEEIERLRLWLKVKGIEEPERLRGEGSSG